MRRFFCVFILVFSSLILFGQDFLSPLSSNPSLFNQAPKIQSNEKYIFTEDSLIFQFDTLSLPFIDDFSVDHLPKKVTLNFSSTDTIIYKYLINGNPISDLESFSLDSSFIYTIGALGDTISKTHNPTVNIVQNDISTYPSVSTNLIAFPAYSILDTIGGLGPDTISFVGSIIQDSAGFMLNVQLSNPRVNDTTFYRLVKNNIKLPNSVEYRTDPTYYFQIGTGGDTVIQQENQIDVITQNRIIEYPLTSFSKTVYPPFNIYDTIGGNGPDTVYLTPNLTQDSATYFIVDKDSNDFYIDRNVLVNNNFPINPKSIGVATFDGLNQYGEPYSPDFESLEKADYLTSLPIDLSNPTGDVFFSFYFQPKGLSLNGPEGTDSLVLEFYLVDSSRWVNSWTTPGLTFDTFQLVMVQVDSIFFSNGFQFRFRNMAQGSGAYDLWHIDYLYLNENRTIEDTVYRDITFVNQPQSLLKDYWAMPWWHFRDNPGSFQEKVTNNKIRNNSDLSLNINYKINLIDTSSNSATGSYYSFPPDNTVRILPGLDTITLNYTIDYEYKTDSIEGPGKLDAIYSIDFRPNPNAPQDIIKSNDTIKTGISLNNFYAYDDGSAEAGYGINPELGSEGYISYMAVQYIMPFADTIGGIDLYFLPQFPDIQGQKFEIVIWNSLDPAGLIYKSPVKYNPIYTDDNGFVTYWFDSLVVVNQNFYLGIRQIGQYSMNIGYDLNTSNKQKIFWSQNGANWNSPSAGIYDGSLMLRPIFRKRNWGVGISSQEIEITQLKLFPNPTKDILNIQLDQKVSNATFQVYSISGKLFKSGRLTTSINVSQLPSGVYFIRVLTEKGNQINRKFVIAK